MSLRATRFVPVSVAIALLTLIACGSGATGTRPPAGEGTLSGTINIGPLCPVEPCSGPVNPYTDLEVVVSSGETEVAVLEVDETGTFAGQVPAGEFVVNLRPCDYMGCAVAMPKAVTVRDGDKVNLSIEIDTGIR